MKDFITAFPELTGLILWAVLVMLGGLAVWGLKKIEARLDENKSGMTAQTETLRRIEKKTDNHGTRIESLEFHAWGRKPPRDPE